MPSLLTVREVASALRCKPHRVLGWIHAGEMLAADLNASRGKPCWRVRPDDLDLFLASRGNQPAQKRNRSRRPATTGVIEFF